MNIKNFQNEYKKGVFDLFEKVFQKKLTNDFWEWRYNYFGDPIQQIMKEKDKVVGHYLLHPIILEFDEWKKKCLFSMTTMTDPDFAGRGIMTKLATEVYKRGTNELYNLVFLFANKNSRYMFTKKLRFKELAVIKELTLDYRKQKTNGVGEIIQIDEFDKQFDYFYEMHKKDLPKIRIPRISNYLNWRFIKNPSVEYYCYKIEDNTKLVGYFVLSKYNKKCQIVDFFIEEDEKYFAQMIKTVFSFCKNKNCETISLWIKS